MRRKLWDYQVMAGLLLLFVISIALFQLASDYIKMLG